MRDKNAIKLFFNKINAIKGDEGGLFKKNEWEVGRIKKKK